MENTTSIRLKWYNTTSAKHEYMIFVTFTEYKSEP